MTKRLSPALKKKLEASLENLTARQSGRLYLIYANECLSNNSPETIQEYPPVVELKAAWDKRVKAAQAKKGTVEEETIAAYNGFLSLTNIIRKSNQMADSDLWRLYTLALAQGNVIDQLLVKDSYSTLAQYTITQFTEDIPRPLSWEDYNKATEWYEAYSPEDLEQLSNELTGDYASRQGYALLEVPDEFLEAISTPEVSYQGEDEGIRRKWVESVGEDSILTKYFAGDQDRFELWKKHGGSPGFNGREWDTMAGDILDRLINKVKAGELEGGVCTGLENHWGFTPALGWDRKNPEDTSRLYIPAWDALRSIWISWLYDEGIFLGDEKRVDETFPDILDTFYDIDGTLEEDRMTVKAKEFYLDCQKKPWGSGLITPDKVDFFALGRSLCAAASPLLEFYAPDLGTVDIKSFHETEGNDQFMGSKDTAGDTWWYATIRGLRGIADELGPDPATLKFNPVRELYYPTDDPEKRRKDISRLIRGMNQLRSSHRPFTYKEKNKREISSFLGLEFYTPLEAAIRGFERVFEDVETFKLTYNLLSQEFFEGIPILAPILRDRLQGVEDALKVTEDILNDWIEKLSDDIWNVETSSLRLVKKGPEETWSRIMAGGVIYATDDTVDNPKTPTWLDGGETFESIAKKISGFDYAGLKKELLKYQRGSK